MENNENRNICKKEELLELLEFYLFGLFTYQLVILMTLNNPKCILNPLTL